MKQFNITQAEHAIIKSDLSRAKRYLHFLEVERAKPESENKGRASVREALSVAAVIAYSRSFTSNYRKLGGKKSSWIPLALIQDLPADMQKLHKQIKDIRD